MNFGWLLKIPGSGLHIFILVYFSEKIPEAGGGTKNRHFLAKISGGGADFYATLESVDYFHTRF